MEAETGVCTDKRRNSRSRSRSRREAESWFFSRASRRNPPCQHHDSDFRPLVLWGDAFLSVQARKEFIVICDGSFRKRMQCPCIVLPQGKRPHLVPSSLSLAQLHPVIFQKSTLLLFLLGSLPSSPDLYHFLLCASTISSRSPVINSHILVWLYILRTPLLSSDRMCAIHLLLYPIKPRKVLIT